MGRLLSFALVFLLSILGAMGISFFEISVTAPVNNNTERLACEIADTSTEDRVTEVDGVRFEIVVPQRIITISPKKPDAFTEVKFGLKITNNSPKTYVFSRFRSLSLDTIAANGEKLQWIRFRSNLAPKKLLDYYSLLQPGESVSFFLKGNLEWLDNQLVFLGSRANADANGVWVVENLRSGNYRFSLIYNSEKGITLSFARANLGKEKFKYFWNGHIATPFIDLCLVNT